MHHPVDPQNASEWLIALREAPADERLASRFDDWLRADAEHVRQWEEVLHLRALLDERQPRGGPSVRPTGVRAGWARRRMQVGLLAACVALVLLLGRGFMPHPFADYRTGSGQIETVALADGSRIALAPHSAIDVVSGPGRREVTLLSGRAFFDVAPNAERPFVVHTRETDVTVLGTSFEVRQNGPEEAVAVRHGKVRVDRGRISEELRTGDRVSLSPAGGIARSRGEPKDIALWREYRLIAQDETFGAVTEEIDAFFDGVVIVADDSLKRQPVTGIYKLDDPEGALQALALSHGARIWKLSPWFLVISGG